MITATEERAGTLGYVRVSGGLYGDILRVLNPDAEELRYLPRLVHALEEILHARPTPDGHGSWANESPGQAVWLATAQVRAEGGVPPGIQKKWRNSEALHELLAKRAVAELREVAKGKVEAAREAHRIRMEQSSAGQSYFRPEDFITAFVYFTMFPEGVALSLGALPPSLERARRSLHAQGRSGPSAVEVAYHLWLKWTGLREARSAWELEAHAVDQAREEALRAGARRTEEIQQEQRTKTEQAIADAAELRREKARASQARKALTVVRPVEPEEASAFDVLSTALGHQALSGGVLMRAPGHFKSLRSVLKRAFIVAGGTAASFERAIERGAVEIIDTISGLRHNDEIIEYVLYNELSF